MIRARPYFLAAVSFLLLAGTGHLSAAEKPAPEASVTAQVHERIVARSATPAEVKRAVSIGPLGDRANILHALYSMRQSAWVRSLLFDLWRDQRKQHPAIDWQSMQSPVLRVALAATMNRIAAGTIPEFLDYLRAQANHELPLVRAQALMALGMNGDAQDIDSLVDGANGADHYVAQSAITGLAFMYSQPAHKALAQLAIKHKDSERGVFIKRILKGAYGS